MLKAAPDGFTVTERAGDAQVVLTRDFNGEKITIAFECTQDGEEFIDDDEEFDEEMDEEGMQGMEEVSGRGAGGRGAGAAGGLTRAGRRATRRSGTRWSSSAWSTRTSTCTWSRGTRS